MTLQIFHAEQLVRRPLPDVFEFFSRAANLERITPPWLSFSVVGTQPAEVGTGTVIPYRLRLHGIPLVWVSQIEAFEPERMFVDRQLIGPYRQWVHRHEFEARGEQTLIRDEVHYELPLGRLGATFGLPFVRRDVGRIFDYRRETIDALLRG